jgi:hypothetical protein
VNRTALGTPAKPTADAASTAVVLAPGDTAQAQVTNKTKNCGAQVSDNAVIAIPGTSRTVTQPMQLRACSVTVTGFATQ